METSPVVRGNLAERQLPEILNQLGRSLETGTLLLQQHSIEKRLFLENGRIIFAVSSDPDDRLGPLLLKRSKVSVKQLEEAALKITTGKRLGTILVLQGILQPNDLYHLVLEQMKEIVFSLFEWAEGTFEFTRGAMLEKEVIVLNIPMPDLIMSGIPRISRWSLIQRVLPSLEAVYRKKEGWSPIVRTMNLTREMEALVDLFDRPRTLDETLKISTSGDFETCRTIWGLLVLGIIEEILVAPDWTSEIAEENTDRIEPGDESTDRIKPGDENTDRIKAGDENTDRIEPADDSIDRIEPPETKTPEMPPAAEPVGPTLKINPESVAEAQADKTSQDILDDQELFTELSFSDLAELTDATETDQKTVPQPVTSSVEPWEMHVLPQIRDFNEVHRYLYEMVALELGNGASNFVGKVFRRASTKYPLVFEGVGMNDFGELEEGPLLANIRSNLVHDYSQALDYLISEERSMISLFLEMRRAEAIEAGLKRILNRRERALQ